MNKAIKVVDFGETIELFHVDLVEKESFNPYFPSVFPSGLQKRSFRSCEFDTNRKKAITCRSTLFIRLIALANK